MRGLLALMTLFAVLVLGSTAAYGGANPHFTLPMHGIYPATFSETCEDPMQGGVDCINTLPNFELPVGATGFAVLYLLCFRHTGSDELQTGIRQRLMREGDFLITQADVSGRRWLRLTIMNPLTDEGTIHRLLDRIEELVGEVPAPQAM